MIRAFAVVAGLSVIFTLTRSGVPPLTALELEAVREPLTVFIADGQSRSGYLPSDHQLAQWALDDWARHTEGAIVWKPTPENDAVIRVYWTPPRIQAFGETQPIDVHGQRGFAVFVRADVRMLGDDLQALARQDPLWRDTIVYLTCVHELGHALGLEHTRGFRDIMYSFQYGGDIVEYFARYRRQLMSRNDIASVSPLSAADIQRLHAQLQR